MVAACMQNWAFCIHAAVIDLLVCKNAGFAYKYAVSVPNVCKNAHSAYTNGLLVKTDKKQENMPVVYRQFFLIFVRRIGERFNGKK